MTATVVIVGYRAYPELRQCLASLARFEPGVDVVVIDHAADPREGTALSSSFPQVAYRPTDRNPGFAAGVIDNPPMPRSVVDPFKGRDDAQQQVGSERDDDAGKQSIAGPGTFRAVRPNQAPECRHHQTFKNRGTHHGRAEPAISGRAHVDG